MVKWVINKDFFFTESERFVYFKGQGAVVKLTLTPGEKEVLSKLINRNGDIISQKYINENVPERLFLALKVIHFLETADTKTLIINPATTEAFKIAQLLSSHKRIDFSDSEKSIYLQYSFLSNSVILSSVPLKITYGPQISDKVLWAITQLIEQNIDKIIKGLLDNPILIFKLDDYTFTPVFLRYQLDIQGPKHDFLNFYPLILGEIQLINTISLPLRHYTFVKTDVFIPKLNETISAIAATRQICIESIIYHFDKDLIKSSPSSNSYYLDALKSSLQNVDIIIRKNHNQSFDMIDRLSHNIFFKNIELFEIPIYVSRLMP